MNLRQLITILRLQIIALLFAFSAATPIAFAQTTAEHRGAVVALTWQKAVVFVPGNIFKTTPDKVNVKKPFPVVIYLHGCTGISPNNDEHWGDFIKGLGYIAVLPDSMARPERKPRCDPKKKRPIAGMPQVHSLRMEEMRYALEQVKKSPWADTKNIFLMGHSEGGHAAASCALADFRGIIISGWTCTDAVHPRNDGIFAPLETPILSLEWDHDAWREGTPQQGSCANKFGERKKARQVLFHGTQHATYDQQEARDEVARFLKENLAP